MSSAITGLDTFTRAYIECALWSSTCDPYGTCPDCGTDNQVLCRWNAEQEHVCMNCSDREPNYEPPMDRNYSVEDLAPGTLARMVADCERFQRDMIEDIAWDNLARFPHRYSTQEKAGHDFWLTRNHHGAGFWDGDWTEPAATRLTDAAHAFGECNLYVGNDGRIYA